MALRAEMMRMTSPCRSVPYDEQRPAVDYAQRTPSLLVADAVVGLGIGTRVVEHECRFFEADAVFDEMASRLLVVLLEAIIQHAICGISVVDSMAA